MKTVFSLFFPIVGNRERARFFLVRANVLHRRLDRLAASPAALVGALVASGVWAVAVLVWWL